MRNRGSALHGALPGACAWTRWDGSYGCLAQARRSAVLLQPQLPQLESAALQLNFGMSGQQRDVIMMAIRTSQFKTISQLCRCRGTHCHTGLSCASYCSAVAHNCHRQCFVVPRPLSWRCGATLSDRSGHIVGCPQPHHRQPWHFQWRVG